MTLPVYHDGPWWAAYGWHLTGWARYHLLSLPLRWANDEGDYGGPPWGKPIYTVGGHLLQACDRLNSWFLDHTEESR